MNKILESIAAFLFPKACLFCGTVGKGICEDCFMNNINLNTEKYCHVCKTRMSIESDDMVHEWCKSDTYLDGVIVCAHYDKNIEKIIADIKYNGFFAYAQDVSEIMLFHKSEILKLYIDLLVPIPIHHKREWSRGFNQTEKIAESLSHMINIPYKNIIKRDRNTETQVGKERAERLINVQDAFSLENDEVISHYQRIMLVDDVMTTGATLEECAEVLKKKGIQKVYAIVLARG